MSRPLRYTFILVLVALGTCLAAVSGWRYARASAPVGGPIILLSIDALRADRLPAYGYAAGHTPAIDALAKDGIVFERAYSHVPQTLPAHASLLSGRLPFETGVRDGAGFKVAEDERMLAEMLADRGYATAGIVSSFNLRKETGIGQGFTLFDAATATTPDTEPPLVRDGAAAEVIAERWFDSAGTERVFLFLHLAEPANDAPAPGVSAITYDARISRADDIVARLVKYLKSHQLYDQSTIILVSDHGQGLGEHGEETHGLLVYDDVLRVPLVIKQAARGERGRRVRTPVQHIDIVPTVLDLAKAPVPASLRGRSLTPLFDDDANLGERVVYAESMFGRVHFGWHGLVSLTDGRYRYIEGATTELYDTETDPSSRQDLAAARPEIAAKFQSSLAELAQDDRIARIATPQSLSDDDRVRLEQLGYVGSLVADDAVVQSPTSGVMNVAVVEEYRRAVRLLETGDMDGALETFRALTGLQPDSADAWRQFASAAGRAEKHDLAADAFRRVMVLAPLSTDGVLGASNALLRIRKFDEATGLAQRLLDDEKIDAGVKAGAHELLARVALGRRSYDAARREAALAEAIDANRPVVAYVNGRIALDQRRYTDALASFESALATLDANKGAPLGDLRLYAAESLLRAGRLSEAEYLFLEQLKTAPLNPRALTGLTAVYKTTGRTDEAASLTQH